MTAHFILRGVWLPKLGNDAAEFEDAYAISHPPRCPASASARYAVADGATMSSFSREWAQLLVEEFTTSPPPLAPFLDPRRLAPLQQLWSEEVASRRLEWFAEEKARKGAFAALVGLWMNPTPGGSGSWRALAIGDACLFQVRGSRVVDGFPITVAAHFSYRPRLLSSRPDANGTLDEAWHDGQWQLGDRFYLMTDALAEWFLGQVEGGQQPWQLLDDHLQRESFIPWMDEQRHARAIRNDDVTLLCVEVGA